MFGGSGVAVGGALAALALLWIGVKELLTFNPKGIFWGAILVGGAIFLAGATGATETEAVAVVNRLVSLAFDVLGGVVAAISSAVGISPQIVFVGLLLILFLAARRGGSKK